MQQSDIAIPILPSRSVNDTLTFFRRLGFEGKIHSYGDYAILTRGTVELHFFNHRELHPAESAGQLPQDWRSSRWLLLTGVAAGARQSGAPSLP